ncbi:MAG: ABC transporter substrate-binding protein [Thermoplasmata archaeon]|nr:ABC transporter substrate-binding protein [Thermoplasmata archaeon]
MVLTSTDSNLWVVGNANLDDTIDEKDIEYIQSIIDGTAKEYKLCVSTWADREEVSMADANADGVIDEKDIEKVRSMIAGEEQIIYYVDVDGIRNSVHYPVSSIVSLYYLSALQIQILGAADRVVACDNNTASMVYLADNFGSLGVYDNTARFDPDAESIMSYNPDIVLTGSREWYCNTLESSLPSSRDSIDIVRLSSWEDGNAQVGTMTLGYILGCMDIAAEYIEWSDAVLDMISEKTSTLSDDEKANIIIPKGRENAMYEANCVGSGRYETSLLAGVNNIADRLGTTQDYITFDEEWLYNQTDLDFIIYNGYDKLGDATHNKEWNDSMVERYSALTAAYGTEIHTVSDAVLLGPAYVIGVIYIAKIVYPELFADMDADALFQDFVDRFMVGWDFDVSAYNAQGGVAV